MGVRTTQIIGLTEAAQQLICGEEVLLYRVEGRRIYPDGSIKEFAEDVRGSSVASEASGSFQGMFGEEYSLYRHTLPDGSVLQEEVQDEPWSSGPCIFLALKDTQGNWVKESLWSDAEIDEML